MSRKRKFTPKPPPPPSGGRMKKIQSDVRWIIEKTSSMDTNPAAIEIKKSAEYWLRVTRGSHWAKMNVLGKTHPDVLEMVEKCKSEGLQVILNYDLTFGDRPQ